MKKVFKKGKKVILIMYEKILGHIKRLTEVTI